MCHWSLLNCELSGICNIVGVLVEILSGLSGAVAELEITFELCSKLSMTVEEIVCDALIWICWIIPSLCFSWHRDHNTLAPALQHLCVHYAVECSKYLMELHCCDLRLFCMPWWITWAMYPLQLHVMLHESVACILVVCPHGLLVFFLGGDSSLRWGLLMQQNCTRP
jgi:hypothetical protein